MKKRKINMLNLKELKNKLWKPLVVIFVALFLVAGVGFAANNGLEIPVKFILTYELASTAPVNTVGAYIASPSTFTDVHITNDLVVDELMTVNKIDGDITWVDDDNSVDTFLTIIDFTDATNTVAVFNPDSLGINDYYLLDVWVENTGKATSTVKLAVTTTTAEVIAKDDLTVLTEDNMGRLIDGLGNAFGADGATFSSETATSSAFSLLHYPGTDTRVGAGKLSFLMNSTTNIIVFATSTNDGAILSPGNTFDGKLYIRGRESNR
jgi:hypothetical protein